MKLDSKTITRHAIPYGLVLIAFTIQVWGLGQRTLHGDETWSLDEVANLTKNLQALSYFLLLYFWNLGGQSEFWLRAPSAFLMVGAVGAAYRAFKTWVNRRVALAAMALLATSPFLLSYGQQIRFYGAFVFATCLAFWALGEYIRAPSNQRRAFLVLADLLVLTTHALGFLVVGFQVLALGLSSPILKSARRRFVLVLVLALFTGILLTPWVRPALFNWLADYTDSTVRYVSSRGIGLAQLAKPPLALYFFALGTGVYPLNYAVVIPGVLGYGVALGLGWWYLRQWQFVWGFVTLIFGASLFLIFIIFDSLIPSGFTGASPRYVIFLLPVFYLMAAAGTLYARTRWVLGVLLIINLVGILYVHLGEWSYVDDLVDWRDNVRRLAHWVTPQSQLILDGRALGIAQHYLPTDWNVETLYDARQNLEAGVQLTAPRVVLAAQNFNQDPRTSLNQLLARLGPSYDVVTGWVEYPLFVYILDRRPEAQAAYQVDAQTGTLHIPVEIYGIEFSDLRLPEKTKTGASPILGHFSLPRDDDKVHRLPLTTPFRARGLVLTSTLTEASRLPPGTPIAELKTYLTDGSTKTFSLRVGYETCSWAQPSGGCQPVATWHKRLALVGAQSYPEAYQDFKAALYAAAFELPTTVAVQALELRRLPSAGQLSIWGIQFQP